MLYSRAVRHFDFLENEGVRDAYLRLSAVHGIEVFWRVPDLAAKIQIGLMVIDYEPRHRLGTLQPACYSANE